MDKYLLSLQKYERKKERRKNLNQVILTSSTSSASNHQLLHLWHQSISNSSEMRFAHLKPYDVRSLTSHGFLFRLFGLLLSIHISYVREFLGSEKTRIC